MQFSRRPNDTRKAFFKRTVSAQLHGLGAILAAVGGYFLLRRAASQNGTAHLIACVTFIFGGIVVMSTSSVYHFLHDGFTISPRLERLFEKLDHTAIYFFIAGTYTPFLINSTQGNWQAGLMIGIWTLAFLGIVYTFAREHMPHWLQNRYLYTGLFIAMGWTVLVRAGAIYHHLSAESLSLFALGAFSYTLGAIVYATQKPRLAVGFFGFHELWHLMVLLGFAFHYFMILNFYQFA